MPHTFKKLNFKTKATNITMIIFPSMPGFIRVSWPGFIQLWYYSVIIDYYFKEKKKRGVGGGIVEDFSNDSWRSGVTPDKHQAHELMQTSLFRLKKKQPSFPAQAAVQTRSGTVLPLLLLSPGRTSISRFWVRTQHSPTCNHSQRTRPRMKPVLRRDQGQGMEKQPMAAFVSRTQLRQRPSWLAYLHSPRGITMLPGILPRCLLIQKQVYFLLAQPSARGWGYTCKQNPCKSP